MTYYFNEKIKKFKIKELHAIVFDTGEDLVAVDNQFAIKSKYLDLSNFPVYKANIKKKISFKADYIEILKGEYSTQNVPILSVLYNKNLPKEKGSEVFNTYLTYTSPYDNKFKVNVFKKQSNEFVFISTEVSDIFRKINKHYYYYQNSKTNKSSVQLYRNEDLIGIIIPLKYNHDKVVESIENIKKIFMG